MLMLANLLLPTRSRRIKVEVGAGKAVKLSVLPTILPAIPAPISLTNCFLCDKSH